MLGFIGFLDEKKSWIVYILPTNIHLKRKNTRGFYVYIMFGTLSTEVGGTTERERGVSLQNTELDSTDIYQIDR